jgi:hypothetical protein
VKASKLLVAAAEAVATTTTIIIITTTTLVATQYARRHINVARQIHQQSPERIHPKSQIFTTYHLGK